MFDPQLFPTSTVTKRGLAVAPSQKTGTMEIVQKKSCNATAATLANTVIEQLQTMMAASSPVELQLNIDMEVLIAELNHSNPDQ